MQQFKRSCLPDGPKVGTVAVSPRGDLRMPSDASAAVWMEALDKTIVRYAFYAFCSCISRSIQL